MNLASNLHNLAGNILNRVQQAAKQGEDLQITAQFSGNGPTQGNGGFQNQGPTGYYSNEGFGQGYFGPPGPPPPPPPHAHSKGTFVAFLY